jgi:hypothetical protein
MPPARALSRWLSFLLGPSLLVAMLSCGAPTQPAVSARPAASVTPTVLPTLVPRADDGRSLQDEGSGTRDDFTSVWGEAAAERWVRERNEYLVETQGVPVVPMGGGPTRVP